MLEHKLLLKQYAQKHSSLLGSGIIFVNLLMLKSSLDEAKLLESEPDRGQDFTIHQPISYIPYGNFWLRTIGMKIKRRYQIDIQQKADNEILVIFIKDVDLEHFSIYTIKY